MSETTPPESTSDVTATVPAPAPVAPPVLPEHVDRWQPLTADAAQVAMIGGALGGLPTGIGAAAALVVGLGTALDLFSFVGGLLAFIVIVLACIGAGVWLGYRGWKSTFWKLDDSGLHVKRGRMWRKEILVPRSRVQHLDIERGPIERRFGLATLTVHTAGTRQHAVRQPGFLDADAVALRDALVPASARNDDVV